MPWLFLSDPEDYPYERLFELKRDVWDGINGSIAQKYLREVKKGDLIIGYHTAPGKAAVCELVAAGDPYQNPKMPGKKNVVIEVEAARWFRTPVPLADMRSNPRLKGMKMFHMMRPVAVSPLTEGEYRELVRLGARGPRS